MSGVLWLLNLVGWVILPWLTVGVIQRTRSWWSGRRGPPLLQSAFDVLRLSRKTSVVSRTTTPIFRLTPYVGLISTLAAAVVVPVLGAAPLLSFRFDFVWLVACFGLGRFALMLGALDTGSSFEGMGASREATFAALVEPALLLVLGALGAMTGAQTLYGMVASASVGFPATVGWVASSPAAVVVWVLSAVALMIVAQAEGARMPVDDPATHLELTMIHEVMVLDHSGPELAAIQTSSALKLTLGLSLLASLLNPWAGAAAAGQAVAVLGNLLLLLGLAVLVGTIESLVARLRMRGIPQYLLGGLVAAGLALLATTWQGG